MSCSAFEWGPPAHSQKCYLFLVLVSASVSLPSCPMCLTILGQQVVPLEMLLIIATQLSGSSFHGTVSDWWRWQVAQSKRDNVMQPSWMQKGTETQESELGGQLIRGTEAVPYTGLSGKLAAVLLTVRCSSLLSQWCGNTSVGGGFANLQRKPLNHFNFGRVSPFLSHFLWFPNEITFGEWRRDPGKRPERGDNHVKVLKRQINRSILHFDGAKERRAGMLETGKDLMPTHFQVCRGFLETRHQTYFRGE